jgi:competence protein ComEC
VLVPLLRALDERVDLLMLSHRDSDHTGGARAVLTSQPQAQLLSSLESGHPLQALRPSRRCVAGQHWDWDGVQFEVLHPLPGDEDGNHAASFKPNALSCVLRISSHPASGPARSALLAGDIEAAQEAQLVARTQANPEGTLRADLLLVPHHGSKTSSTPVFLDAVQPRYAVIQTGYRNRYGHPAEPVQARYRERGIVMLDSPHCGALTWRSAEAEKWTCQRDQARRYWHHVIR